MSSSGQFLYHYTSTAGANGIRKDGVIKCNNGVNLLTLKPEEHTRDEILHKIHGNSIPHHFKNRADNVVFVDPSTLDYNKVYEIKPYLYKYSGDIKVNAGNVRDKPAYVSGKGNTGSQLGSTSAGSSSNYHDNKNKQTLYYYTNKNTASQIISNRRIFSNSIILLTTLNPENNYRDEILKSIYGRDFQRPQYATLADWCVKIDGTKLNAKKLKNISNEVYEYSDSISVDVLDVMDKPKCNKGGQITKASCCMIKIRLRNDIQYDARSHQDQNVKIFAFKWLKEGLNKIQSAIGKEISLNIQDSAGCYIKSDFNEFSPEFSMKHLQIIARNESFNTNGEINFENFIGISRAVVYSLKDLVRQTVIVGRDYTTNYGGYPHDTRRVPQEEMVYLCDLIGLQFQQNYNSGRLVIVGENLPKGLLDDFIYETVVKEKKPTVEHAKNDKSGRFVHLDGVFLDTDAYVKFVANDVLITGMALNHCAAEPINLKFLKYGTGYFAGPFRNELDNIIGRGVAKGLRKLLKNHNYLIKRIELPFFNEDPEIGDICATHNVELVYGRDDGLKKTHNNYMTASTNCGDPHAMTGNKMGFGSIDGCIAENLRGKAIQFSPIINKLMQECYLDSFQ